MAHKSDEALRVTTTGGELRITVGLNVLAHALAKALGIPPPPDGVWGTATGQRVLADTARLLKEPPYLPAVVLRALSEAARLEAENGGDE